MEPEPYRDPVIAVYKRDVDRTLLRVNLRLTPAQRLEKMLAALRLVTHLHGAARPNKHRKPSA